MTAVRIRARRDGFRRCGVAHPARDVEHPAGRFTAAEIEALEAEPALVVERVVSRTAKKADPPSAPAPTARRARKKG